MVVNRHIPEACDVLRFLCIPLFSEFVPDNEANPVLNLIVTIGKIYLETIV